ncbi:MAG: HEAT repeat domain-containing protein [Moorea sp. SIO2I5]|nr:HEAT repeat domain-containing protein [Moorena sp. SIO2I5]
MTFYPELNHLTLNQLIERFHKQPLEGEDASTYYSEIALLISQQGEQGVEYLYESINGADQERLRGIIFALTESQTKTEKLRKIMFRYLDDQRPMIVAEAIDGLCKLEEKHAIDHVLVMLDHYSPYVRGSVLRFLARLYPEQALPHLLDKLKDPHFIVRENAVDELDELGNTLAVGHATRTVVSYLKPLLSDPHPDVQQAVQTAIQNLSTIAS